MFLGNRFKSFVNLIQQPWRNNSWRPFDQIKFTNNKSLSFDHFTNNYQKNDNGKNKLSLIYLSTNLVLLASDKNKDDISDGISGINILDGFYKSKPTENIQSNDNELVNCGIYNITKEHYDRLYKHIGKYIDDSNYVYKTCIRCDNEYLIVLKRDPGTITNEKRDGIVDSSKAMHLGSKFEIAAITLVNDPTINFDRTKKMHKPYQYDDPDIPSTTVYKVGAIIQAEYPYRDGEPGIIFFTDVKRAISYRHGPSRYFTGRWNDYLDNGQLVTSYNYTDGRKISSNKKELLVNNNPSDSSKINIIIKVSVIFAPLILFKLAHKIHLVYKSRKIINQSVLNHINK